MVMKSPGMGSPPLSTPETAARIAAARLRSSPSSSAALISAGVGRASAATRKVHERSTDCAIVSIWECFFGASAGKGSFFFFFPFVFPPLIVSSIDRACCVFFFFAFTLSLFRDDDGRKQNKTKCFLDIALNSCWFRRLSQGNRQ